MDVLSYHHIMEYRSIQCVNNECEGKVGACTFRSVAQTFCSVWNFRSVDMIYLALEGDILATHTGKSYWQEKIKSVHMPNTFSVYTWILVNNPQFTKLAKFFPNQNFPVYSSGIYQHCVWSFIVCVITFFVLLYFWLLDKHKPSHLEMSRDTRIQYIIKHTCGRHLSYNLNFIYCTITLWKIEGSSPRNSPCVHDPLCSSYWSI